MVHYRFEWKHCHFPLFWKKFHFKKDLVRSFCYVVPQLKESRYFELQFLARILQWIYIVYLLQFQSLSYTRHMHRTNRSTSQKRAKLCWENNRSWFRKISRIWISMNSYQRSRWDSKLFITMRLCSLGMSWRSISNVSSKCRRTITCALSCATHVSRAPCDTHGFPKS